MGYEGIVEEIKSRVDIVEIVSEYLNLKKTGENFKALCPFHSEKTPSFVISPSKQIFHCFGCGAGGDVFSFLMRYENISFQDALKLLAERTGIELKFRKDDTEKQGRRQVLLEIHRAAAEYFHQLLWDRKEPLDYLIRRGLTRETIREFFLGYAPGGGDVLFRYLTDKGFSRDDILAAGVCKKGESMVMDTFRNRIIFPIFNIRGDVIAFGGRIFREGSMAPKYLNSPETTIFRKSYELYGLYHAKREINKKGYVILTEGYLDVIACSQAGIRNVVAPLGTALTEHQLRKLKPLTRKVLLLFDSDDAGIKATMKAFSMIYAQGMLGKVVLLPEGDDPDSYIKQKGTEAFRRLIGNAMGLVDFYLATSRSGEVETVGELIRIISKVDDGVMRAKLVKDIAEKTSLAEVFIREELTRHRRGMLDSGGTLNISSHAMGVEEMLLSLLLNHPEYIKEVRKEVVPEQIENERLRRIFLKLLNSDGGDIISRIDEEEKAYISRILLDTGFDEEELDKNVKDCIKRLRERGLRKRLREIQEEIRIAAEKSDRELLTLLQKKWTELVKEGQQSGIL